MRKRTIVLFALGFFCTLFVFQSCASDFLEEATRVSKSLPPIGDQWLVFKIFLLVSVGGMLGGFVYALETKDTYTIVRKDAEFDTGAWGHIFIGFCGGLVALAVILGVFGLDLSSISTSATPQFTSVKYTFYVLAIGILGGYSGLPIISLISNAAIKKVQQEVDQLKKDTEKEVDNLKKSEEQLQNTVKHFEGQLRQKNDELHTVTLQSILLTAESHARNGNFNEAIELITNKYLKVDKDEPKAYFWLAFSEKRRGNVKKAIECIKQSIKLKPSRTGYFNLACYLSLDSRPIGEVIDALSNAWNETLSDQDKEKFKENLQSDKDFDNVRTTAEFVAFADQISK